MSLDLQTMVPSRSTTLVSSNIQSIHMQNHPMMEALMAELSPSPALDKGFPKFPSRTRSGLLAVGHRQQKC